MTNLKYTVYALIGCYYYQSQNLNNYIWQYNGINTQSWRINGSVNAQCKSAWLFNSELFLRWPLILGLHRQEWVVWREVDKTTILQSVKHTKVATMVFKTSAERVSAYTSLGTDAHTYRHTRIPMLQTKAVSRNQAQACTGHMPGSKRVYKAVS